MGKGENGREDMKYHICVCSLAKTRLFLPQGQFSQRAKHTVRDDGVSPQILAKAQMGCSTTTAPIETLGPAPAGEGR